MISLLRSVPSTFVPDNTLADVTAAQNPFIADRIFKTSGGQSTLAPKDNWTLRDMAIWMPYLFATGKTSPNIFINNWDGAIEGPWPGVPGAGYRMFQENVQIPIGLYIPFTFDTARQISCNLSAKVSQFGAPDLLNGIEQNIEAFITIEHTLPLT